MIPVLQQRGSKTEKNVGRGSQRPSQRWGDPGEGLNPEILTVVITGRVKRFPFFEFVCIFQRLYNVHELETFFIKIITGSQVLTLKPVWY